MGELLKEQTSWPEETWINLLQHATEIEIDAFVSLLEENGLKIISVEKFNQVMAAAEALIKENEALEYRIKTLMKPC